MGKLIILRGISGSGKTTWAKDQNGIVISRDDIRKMLFGSDGPEYYLVDKELLTYRENTVTVARDSQIEALLRAGYDVYADDTNIEWKYVKSLAKIAYRSGSEVEIKVFDVPFDKAISQNYFRSKNGGRNVDVSVIKKQYSRFQGTKTHTLDPVLIPKPYAGTPSKPKAFLVDIDGTLAHMNGKRGPFDWKNVGLDDVDEVVADLVSRYAIGSGYKVIVMSGRDESCRLETEDWLISHDIFFDEVFMRPEKDMRPDNLIKAELFDTYVRDNYDVKFVIDDRDQVVRMWKTMGLKVLNVAGLDDGIF